MRGQPEVCALIPARGGSRGIPGKNVRPLAGLPLVAHSIEAARAAASVSRIIVSTDDEVIGAVAHRHGAQVVWRPPELSGDTASSESALLHALDHLHIAESYQPDLVVFLQPTSPFRGRNDVQQAVDLLRAEGADSLFSACEARGFTWRLRAGSVAPVNYDPAERPRRQDLTEQIIIENGSIYVFKPEVLRLTGSRLGGRIVAYMMPVIDSFEVDEPEDLELMEQLARIRPTLAPKS